MSANTLNIEMERPWGYYTTVYGDDTSGYKVKKIVVYPKGQLSLQTHKHREEHWVIVKGQGKVRVDDDYFSVSKGIHIFIPKGAMHRIENTSSENLEFIETQIGDYLGEDDIIRYEDVYNRV